MRSGDLKDVGLEVDPPFNPIHSATVSGVRRQLVPESVLPARYQTPWRPGFEDEAAAKAPAGGVILDVGGGDRPTIPPGRRPPECHYVGLDPDVRSLAAGEYDERIEDGAETTASHLIGQVDLIVSFNAFEHVPNMTAAIDSFYELLRPGGTLLARFAGRWAFFAVASRMMPHRARTRLLSKLIHSDEDDHFPTQYDRCSAKQLNLMLSSWSFSSITPLYRGAGYFAFSRPLQLAYLAYEEQVAMRTPQLATHYQVHAVK